MVSGNPNHDLITCFHLENGFLDKFTSRFLFAFTVSPGHTTLSIQSRYSGVSLAYSELSQSTRGPTSRKKDSPFLRSPNRTPRMLRSLSHEMLSFVRRNRPSADSDTFSGGPVGISVGQMAAPTDSRVISLGSVQRQPTSGLSLAEGETVEKGCAKMSVLSNYSS